MPLLTHEDLETALNFDLTDPNGQALAAELIEASVAFISNQVDYAIEQASQTDYFDGGFNQLWLPTGAPVSGLDIATYTSLTRLYLTNRPWRWYPLRF